MTHAPKSRGPCRPVIRGYPWAYYGSMTEAARANGLHVPKLSVAIAQRKHIGGALYHYASETEQVELLMEAAEAEEIR